MAPRWHRPDWEAFARSVGFSYWASNDMMPAIWDEICVIEGSLSRRPVRAAAFIQRRRDPKAVVKASLRPLGLTLATAGVGSAIASVFGAQDVVVGDAAFDEAVVIKAKEPDRAKGIFLRSDWIRSELTRRAADDVELRIEEAAVVVERRDVSIASVRAEMEWAASLAAELERAAAVSSYRTG